MNLNESEWYFILFLLVLIALAGLNEAGYGAIAFFAPNALGSVAYL